MRGLLLVTGLVLCSGTLIAQAPYGAATSGSGGFVPTLSCNQAWMGNSAFELQVDRGLGGANALLGISFAQDNFSVGNTDILISLAPLDLLLLVPLTLSGPTGSPGDGSAPLGIPVTIAPVAGLAGFELYAQAVIDDTNAGVLSATNGLTIELTYPPSVFAGSSTIGVVDPAWLVDPVSQTISETFTSQTDGVNAAEFARGGRFIYLSMNGGRQIAQMDRSTSPVTRSPLYLSSNFCDGVGIDHDNDLLYTLTTGSSGGRELIAIDIALGSPTYGLPQNNTNGLWSVQGFVERWSLSPTGNFAAALTSFNPELIIINTDPFSPNYLTWTNLGTVPATGGGIFVFTPKVVIDPRGEIATILVSPGGGAADEIARYDLVNGVWLDHNVAQPGIQNMGPASLPVVGFPAALSDIEISRDGSFAIVVGMGGAGGAARIDFDIANPYAWMATPLVIGAIPSAASVAIEPDGTQFVASSYAIGGSQLVYVNTMTGAITGLTPLPGGSPNIYALTWR